MQTERRLISDIVPYDRNPRDNKDAVKHVLESLKKHGQVKPLVCSAIGHPFEQEVLCCGHTTMTALKEYGATYADVVVHQFKDEAEFVDFNIRDNKSSEFSMWDDTLLSELSADFEIDLDEMGFNLDDLEDIDDGGGMSEDTEQKIKVTISFHTEEERRKFVERFGMNPDSMSGDTWQVSSSHLKL